MLVDSSTRFRIADRREKMGYLSQKNGIPVCTKSFYPQNNNQDIKRPLNDSQHDLSFEGLSFMPRLYRPLEKTYSKKEFLEFSKKYLGSMGEELLENVAIVHKKRTNKLISMDGDNITIHKKTIPHLAWDGILYPFKILPGDILNGLVEAAGKLPGLKIWSENTLKRPMFKNIRQRSKIDKKVNSLVGMITYRENKLKNAIEGYKKVHGIEPDQAALAKIKDDIDKNMHSSVFQTITKPFDYKTGNYDTKHERALNRLVSGLPPAIFLANDAYNLSRMMDDDPKAAEKERKTRFKQETSRILTSGYLTLITMGAFQKFINKSKFGIVLTTGITVLVTEMFSRLSNGKYITRLTPEQARKINEKEHAPEAQIKPVDNNGQVSSTGNSKQKEDKSKEQQKPLLSFDTLMKASAAVLAVGYAIKGFKNIPAIKNSALKFFKNMDDDKIAKLGIDKNKLNLDNAVKTFEDKVIYRPFTQLYKKMTSEKFIVEPEKFDDFIKTLRSVKIEEIIDGKSVKKEKYGIIADRFEQVAKNEALKYKKGDVILDKLDGLSDEEKKLAKPIYVFKDRDKKIKPLVNFVIAPFKFMWNTVTLPYWMIDEKVMSVFRKSKPKSTPKDLDAIAASFGKISKKAQDFAQGKMTESEFMDYVEINMTNGFNRDSMSNVSNAELSNLAKTAASVATIWFLMTDNYNMVMLKSNGNDKDGANTKFKERFVQEGSRLFYQTLLIDLFNSTFRNSYNASLLGMSWVTLADTTLGEILTRSSVGIPVKAHTRDELIDIETKQNNSTGFKKKYYNFMQRLTGKRSIKTYEVAPKGAQKELTTKIIPNEVQPFQKRESLLEQMIRG